MTDISQGFPIPPQQRVPHEDWDRAPWNRWTFQHIREYVPTTEVWRGNGPVWTLERNPQDLSEQPCNSGSTAAIPTVFWCCITPLSYSSNITTEWMNEHCTYRNL